MSELACEAIVLDLGGVLIDVQFDNAISYWHQCAGLPQTSADDIHYQPGIAYEQHERGEIGFPEFANSLREQLNFELDLEQWRQGWNASLGNTISGAHDLIRQIAHDRPVYLFSNSNATHFQHWREQHHELLLPMRDVFVSHELGMRKPDPDAYRAIAMQMDTSIELIAFFDDRADNVQGARQAGLQAFTANSPADVAQRLGIALQ